MGGYWRGGMGGEEENGINRMGRHVVTASKWEV